MMAHDFGSPSDQRGTAPEKLWGIKAAQQEQEEEEEEEELEREQEEDQQEELGQLKSGVLRGRSIDKHMQRILSWLQDDGGVPTMAFAPQWLYNAPVVAGRVVKLGAKPGEVLSAIFGFLRECAIPGEVETVDAWTLCGVLFVDFCLVGVQITIFSEPRAQTAVVHFQHTSGGDIVRFTKLVGLVLKSLESCGIRGDFQQNASLDEDWFGSDDFSHSELEAEPWPQRVKSVLETAGLETPIASQEEAWRTLASWAAKESASRPFVAALFTGPAKVALVSSTFARASSTPLSVLYPMAAAIRFAAMAPDACPLADQLLEALPALDELPPLVHHELALALRLLRGPGVETYR